MLRSTLAQRAVRFVNSHQNVLEIHRKAPPPVSEAAPPVSEVAPPGIRDLVAGLYLSGQGIEIGALNGPLPLPPGAFALYVDRLGTVDLKEHYPGLDIVEVDIVDDGERLVTVAEASQDFIVANHVLEHCQDPIGTLLTIASRLKPGGVLYMAVPDADFTFDRERESTTAQHLVEDHVHGPARSRVAHYREWVESVEGLTDAPASASRMEELMQMGYSIHFHVWRMHGLVGFLTRCIEEFGLQMKLEMVMRHGSEVICVLRRTTDAPGESS
jgi:SAM-dependent methyltransferase